MSIFGNKNIIPDDIAEKIAQNLFVYYNRHLEYHIDEDLERYDAYEDLKLKPFWHYCSGDHHYTLKIERRITEEMDFYDLFVKGNGYISLDRFNCIHTVNKESFLKVLDLVKEKFASQDKSFVYRIFYDKTYKSKCFIPYAYITLEQKLLRGEGKGYTTMCRFPKPLYQRYILKPEPYEIIMDSTQPKADVSLSGITLLSEKEVLAHKKLINFQQKDKIWWLRERFPNIARSSKAIQPNERIIPSNMELRNGISPAVIGNFNKIKRGDKLLFAGHMWTVITADMMLVDDLLGVGPYNYYSVEDIKYEESDIKAFIDGWFAAHRDNPVYVVSSSVIK